MKRIFSVRIWLSFLVATVVIATVATSFAYLHSSHAHAAGSGEQGTLTDPCQTIATLNKGQTVTGSVSITTSDPDEDGEGEGGVTISDTESQSLNFTGYVVVHPFQITANAANDAVTVCYSSDGDENLNLESKVGSFTALPYNDKQYFSNLSNGIAILGAVFGTALSISCLGVTAFAGSVACVAVGTVLGVGATAWSYRLGELAGDPDDPNCTIAKPANLTYPTYQPSSDFTYKEARATNTLSKSLANQTALSNALYISLNRYQGALDAKNRTCARRQISIAQGYAKGLADLLLDEPDILSDFAHAGFPKFAVTAANVSQFESNIATNGLSSQQIQELTQLGITGSAATQVQELLTVQDPNAVVQLGGGYFPQALTDPSITQDLRITAVGLEQFAHKRF